MKQTSAQGGVTASGREARAQGGRRERTVGGRDEDLQGLHGGRGAEGLQRVAALKEGHAVHAAGRRGSIAGGHIHLHAPAISHGAMQPQARSTSPAAYDSSSAAKEDGHCRPEQCPVQSAQQHAHLGGDHGRSDWPDGRGRRAGRGPQDAVRLHAQVARQEARLAVACG